MLEAQHPPRAFLEAAVQAMPAFMVCAGADDRITFINRLQPGLELPQVIGQPLWEFTDPAHVSVQNDAIAEVRRTGDTARYQVLGTGPHGEPAHYDCYVRPLPEEGGVGVCLIALDVTEHRLHQEALRRSEERLKVALDAIPIGLWSWELLSGELVWDERMHELTGRDEPVPPDRYLELVVHPDDRPMVRAAIERTAATGDYDGVVHRVLRPDGTVRWAMPTGRSVRDEGGDVVRIVGALLDITEQRTVEERLRRAQKLEAVGRLTAGVAHNFNNMLAAILPTLELLRREVSEPSRALVDDAHHAGTRAAEMVHQLMTFSGQRPSGSWTPCEPSALVRGALAICERTFGRHIVLVSRVPDRLPSIVGDAGGLEQVIVNLLLNARDAVEEAGLESPRLRIDVDVVALGAPQADRRPGDYVRIRVRDEGVGMSADVRERVFEPFFTTKPVDAGTGLGLATSYTIVREHGGWIDCDSAVARGTTFSVFLPVAPGAREAVEAANGVAPKPICARVLLVDDEAAVRRVIERLLVAIGHEVVLAHEGAAALEALERESGFDVILLDRSMPGAPGERFVPRIRELAPDAKILFFTGQSVSEVERRLVDGVVLKPVTRAQLEESIHRALRGRVIAVDETAG